MSQIKFSSEDDHLRLDPRGFSIRWLRPKSERQGTKKKIKVITIGGFPEKLRRGNETIRCR